MNGFLEKYILISGFLAFLEVKVLGKCLVKCKLDQQSQSKFQMFAQSKFQMFALFSRGHMLVSLSFEVPNMAALYSNLCKIFRQIFEVRENVET